MNDFTYYNPTRIVFGRGRIGALTDLVPAGERIMLTYGGGSIKRTGVYDKVLSALRGRDVVEFGGIEANPEYETLLRAAKMARSENVGFLLAVGGGSVLDGTKFIAAAALHEGDDPWRILETRGAKLEKALPLGSVLTLPATGSESNPSAVISRRATQEKLHFTSEAVFPVFSILDPETTFTLPAPQLRNGIVDTYVHVMEQYATYPAGAPLQARQSEAILTTLIEEAQAMLAEPPSYEARANLMWCATQGLSGLVGLGVPQDWSTHMIGHELTAFYGMDHAVSLSIALPGVLQHQLEPKRTMLEQYGRRVMNVQTAEESIHRTEAFFRAIGMPTRLSEVGVDAEEAAARIGERFAGRKARLGEHRDLDGSAIESVLRSRA
jgi:NADP-dependent alcohol dehydrogenase